MVGYAVDHLISLLRYGIYLVKYVSGLLGVMPILYVHLLNYLTNDYAVDQVIVLFDCGLLRMVFVSRY